MQFYERSKINNKTIFFFSFQSFFGRTYNNLSSISECKNNGECVINKKNRTACKACRLRKCLLVGMSKSGSRYGRRSNWFKIHCLLQEQQQKNSSCSTTSPSILPNTFLPSHFLSSMCSNKQESRRTSSSSDSGASSADLEDNSIREGSIESCSVESKTEKSSTDSYRPGLDVISPYMCRSIESYPHSFPIIMPSVRIPIIPIEEQNEPIDLSLKSRQRSKIITPPPIIVIENSQSMVKPVPLDLTLVRPKSLSG